MRFEDCQLSFERKVGEEEHIGMLSVWSSQDRFWWSCQSPDPRADVVFVI